MKTPNEPHGRGPQILETLANNGPLSVRGLSVLLEPVIKRRQLQRALFRLFKRRLIEKQYSNQFRGVAVYYRTTQEKKYWPEIALMIDRKPNSLFQLPFRPVEYIHSETCSVWAYHFEKLFKDGIAIRDFQIQYSGIAKELVLAIDDHPELLPDILFVLPTEDGSRLVSIAIEIERYVKSDERTLMKLKKFAAGSRLDGVIWLCDGNGIASRLRDLYNARVIERANRVNNYGNNFMLFHADLFNYSKPEVLIKNAACEYVDIRSWINKLSTTPLIKRHDRDFDVARADGRQLQYA